MSSQIEGTQVTLEDILDPNIEENANRDVTDVVNYVRAVDFAIKRLDDLPICCRMIKETHAILMESTRGEDKRRKCEQRECFDSVCFDSLPV